MTGFELSCSSVQADTVAASLATEAAKNFTPPRSSRASLSRRWAVAAAGTQGCSSGMWAHGGPSPAPAHGAAYHRQECPLQPGLCTASSSGWISLGNNWDSLVCKAVWGLACPFGHVVVAWKFMTDFSVIMQKGIPRSHRICWSFMKAFQLSNQNAGLFLRYLLSLANSKLPQSSPVLRKLVKVVGWGWVSCVCFQGSGDFVLMCGLSRRISLSVCYLNAVPAQKIGDVHSPWNSRSACSCDFWQISSNFYFCRNWWIAKRENVWLNHLFILPREVVFRLQITHAMLKNENPVQSVYNLILLSLFWKEITIRKGLNKNNNFNRKAAVRLA